MTQESELEKQVNDFNQKYNVGDKVEVTKHIGVSQLFTDEIKHEATILGGHSPVVWLKEKGCYNINHILRKL